MASSTRRAFFYGTLMHPKILTRVIGNNGEHLKFCPALLHGYTRHQVLSEDYPGVIPYDKGVDFFKRELPEDDRCVRGTVVEGLTDRDIMYLDIFEGHWYDRAKVQVYALGPFAPVSTHNIRQDTFAPEHPPPVPDESSLPPPLDCETYIFNQLNRLAPEPWDFESFVKENAWKWYGEEADRNEDMSEVDRRREMYSDAPAVASS
ncbi:hypothetical protein BDQ17DRAFT_1355254 [Cyathus striatus]|nr:hypothetical protein BDQ17DRAFT_1355254 [Cyathus striatus]